MISSFADNGFLVVDVGVDDFDDILSGVAPLYGDDTRVQDAWQSVEAVRRLALDAKMLRILELLHGRKPFAFQTLNFRVGTQQLTHSDIMHFSSTPADFMAGVWVALEDVDAENGPLHYYPGSHRLPHLTLDMLGQSGWNTDITEVYVKHYEPAIARIIEEQGLVKHEAYLKKGQAVIWAANLLHGGSPIRDPGRSRHSQVTHYYFEGCRYWTPLLSDREHRYQRFPYDVSSGLHVTRFGRVAQDEDILRRSWIPW